MHQAVYRKLQVSNRSNDFHQATKVVEVPLIEPLPNQIRIRCIYVGVNAVDIKTVNSKQIGHRYPLDIGFETIGLIDSLGSEVAHATPSLKVGQPVMVLMAELGAFAEYVYVEEKNIILVPDVKPEYLATLLNGLTSWIGLQKIAQLRSEETILITAAAGGTGQMAVQCSKELGAQVVAITSTKEKISFVQELGAHLAISHTQENLDSTLKSRFPNGIDVIWETIGGETFKTLSNHLASNGRMLIVGNISEYRKKRRTYSSIEVLEKKLEREHKQFIEFFVFRHANLFKEYIELLIKKIDDGQLMICLDFGDRSNGGRFFGIDQIYRAEEVE